MVTSLVYRWEFRAELSVAANTIPELLVEVWDSDLGKDDLLGVARVGLASLTRGPVREAWHALANCKTGEVGYISYIGRYGKYSVLLW